MALYSLRLAPIGKTTQKRAFTAAANIRYITRKEALSLAMAERMPGARTTAMRWLRQQEKADRVNARVADKLVIALPVELSLEQQRDLVWTFAETLTQRRVSWFAAIHARGKDKANPHVHLLVRDRDVATGRRVVMFSAGAKEIAKRRDKGETSPTTLRAIRELWAKHLNGALAAIGSPERVDHRSLLEQGALRFPQIHEGPNVRAMHARGVKPTSKDRVVRNAPGARQAKTRTVRYGEIDAGLSRVEYNLAMKSIRMSTTQLKARQLGIRHHQSSTILSRDRSRGR